MSEAVQVGKDGTRPAGSAPASLTTDHAEANPVNFYGEKEPGRRDPRDLTSGRHPAQRKGLDGPANRGPPAAARFFFGVRADRSAGSSAYAGPL